MSAVVMGVVARAERATRERPDEGDPVAPFLARSIELVVGARI